MSLGDGADGLEEGGEVVVDGGVGKAQNDVASGGEEGFALGIVLALGRIEVDGAVELDDEATIGAAEIDDERSDGMLAAKLKPEKATIAEVGPEQLLGGSLPRSQVAAGRYVVAMPWTMLGHGDSFAEIPHSDLEQPSPQTATQRVPGPVRWARGFSAASQAVLPSPRARGEGLGMRGLREKARG